MKDHLLQRAIRGEPVERTPVWAMRQAGRWDPEFQKLRVGHTFYEFSENVELAAEASLCPKRFGVDAIILFYDITTLSIAMGQPFTLHPGRGPVPEWNVKSRSDVQRLSERPDPSRYGHVIELLKSVKRKLAGELPVLVFAGAPFTVATYSIGTGKDVEATRRFAAEHPTAWAELLSKITSATIEFLNELRNHGADAWQLFDSWAGALTMEEYDAWALPGQQAVFSEVTGVPRILFVKECPHEKRLFQVGADVVGLGTRHDLATLKVQRPEITFQGNVSDELMEHGTPEQVAEATKLCLQAGGARRHVLNLSHGMNKGTPVENFQAFVDTAKSFRLGQ